VFKGLAGLGSLLKNASEISSRMEKMGDELRSRRVTGTSGGGMVEVEANGLCEVVRCRIDPSLVAQQDRELIEDLVVGAINDAVAKARQLHADAVRSMTGGISLPGMEDVMAKFLKPDADNPPPSV
jgi:DNA-binding YbaB/EbfC family protein